MKRIAPVVIAILSLFVLVSAKRRSVSVPAVPQLNLVADRSFAVTDQSILQPFTFLRVLDRITDGSGVTSEALFRQWWSLQTEPQCHELLNGQRRRCPTDEGKLATAPFRPDDFVPTAILNRFDQASATQCGQYRIIFANRQLTSEEAFHIIFEAEMPNPRPELGLAACKPVAQFWADLSKVDSAGERRARMERFFFEGIDGFPPAIDADHYHQNQAGIRTLQFTLPHGFPSFYQFRLVRENGALVMKTDVLENLALFNLIDGSNQDERAVRFRKAFLENLPNLIVRDVNLYFVKFPSEFLIPDAAPSKGEFLFPLNVGFFKSLQTPEGKAYEAEILAELERLGSTLTPQQVVVRAETQNCIGCHFLGTPVGEGVEFPAANDNSQHVMDNGTLSPAMRNVFIPHRMKILKDFLISGKAPVHSN
jgi:hypothetical protein